MVSANLLRRISTELEQTGFILESDPLLPSVATIVAGEAIKGSWWGHPQGRVIWRVLGVLGSRRDILTAKLVSRKVTFVHRSVWPELFAIGSSREHWQMKGLSEGAAGLLKKVSQAGEMTTELEHSGKAALELERRLLVQSQQFHTPSGSHAKRLRSWENWSRMSNLQGTLPSTADAKSDLESRLGRVNALSGGQATLPWE